MFVNSGYISYVIIILVILVFVWIIKRYFRNNVQQLEGKEGSFIQHGLDTDAATSDTITESNNVLSKKRFDGINRNPEYYAKNSQALQDQDEGSDENLLDIANETVKDQPGDKRLSAKS